MMAEENEKKTLRGLIQSPASLADILIGKSLVVGLFTLVSLIISLAILGKTHFLAVQPIIGLIFCFFSSCVWGWHRIVYEVSSQHFSIYYAGYVFIWFYTNDRIFESGRR